MIAIVTLNKLIGFLPGNKLYNRREDSLALIHLCFYRNTNQIEKSKMTCYQLILNALKGVFKI